MRLLGPAPARRHSDTRWRRIRRSRTGFVSVLVATGLVSTSIGFVISNRFTQGSDKRELELANEASKTASLRDAEKACLAVNTAIATASIDLQNEMLASTESLGVVAHEDLALHFLSAQDPSVAEYEYRPAIGTNRNERRSHQDHGDIIAIFRATGGGNYSCRAPTEKEIKQFVGNPELPTYSTADS